MNDINPIIHTVMSGDTLYNIAIRYSTTVQEILNNNPNLEPYNLQIGHQIYIYPNYSQYYCISENEVNLLKQMNLVWEQHIIWTRMLLISIAENLKDLDATETRLLQNPRDIANVFRRYYGNSIATTLENLLTEHLKIGKDLIATLKNNNQKLASELNTKWYRNADEMAVAFSNINPFYPRETVRQMFYNHLKLTSNEVSARLKGDYTADIKAFDTVQKEILEMSQFFVDGIVRQFPNMF